MRQRLSIRRIIYLHPFRLPNSSILRPFTQNTTLAPRSRPQLPFLSTTSHHRRPLSKRFLTTETKQWIKDEVWRAGKYTTVLWTGTFLVLVIAFGVQQEWLERKFPSPHEWSWVTRKNFRSARWDEEHEQEVNSTVLVDWARTGEAYRQLLSRLEDAGIDGKGIMEQGDGGILVDGVGKTGFDISSKPESWRGGYYEVLLGAARAAEHLDNWVRDRSRNIAFPADVVVGSSNPNPRPVPPGAKSPPREEDCEPAFEAPETFYMRALTTKGFTEKQRVDAALAYGAWLDYKNTPEAALEMYKWALDIANSSSLSASTSKPIVDHSGVLNLEAGAPSTNILSAITGLAVHHALNNQLSQALPIFLSILRARRSLPEQPKTMLSSLNPEPAKESLFRTASTLVSSIFVAPPYPAAPSDGTESPQRTPEERCLEAGIMTNIGEILYASKTTSSSKEDGLAWTREGVDLAESELHRKNIDKSARKTCKQCLEVSLSNWATMVSRLSEHEKAEKRKGGKVGSWLGFGGVEAGNVVGRWESEEQVVRERINRAREVLGKDVTVRGGGLASSFLTV